MTDALAQSIADWRALVGAAHVVDDRDALRATELATFATAQRVPAIVSPASADEVAACVRIARRHRVPLYPVSGGKSWGYGSRVPPESGTVVLDLGRLDRISDYDEELATVRIEPGVRQEQLSAFLAAKGGRLWMDPTASSSRASVLANALERGHGFTPYADHAATLTDLEVVLGTGELVRTGFRALGADRVAALDACGVGPALAGLFFQSNFGIVTRATLWLLPAPEHTELALLRADDDDAMGRALDRLRPLRLERAIRTGPRFSNVYRGLQYRGFPAGEPRPLPLARALELGAAAGLAPWSGVVGLYGTRAEVALQRERVAAALAGVAAVRFAGAAEVDALPEGAAKAQLRGQLALFGGRTAGEGAAVSLPYWRKKVRPTSGFDPDRDRCGTLWTTATTPLTGADARALVAIVNDVVPRHGFEPDISLISLRERTLSYHLSVTYDRDDDGDDERALACTAELRQRLLAAGYPPYRLALPAMDVLQHGDPAYGALLAALKRAVDPDGILAPGRYVSTPP